MIKLDKDTVHSVCSGQVITSPYSIVKELTENSLDAGATIVDVRVEECGLQRIEVRDNGSGIKKEEVSSIALPYYTSKLLRFSDLSSITTYGYRGEALSAVCSVSDMNLITRHSSNNTASSYTIGKDGHTELDSSCHNNIGTTIIVTNLFKTLPVRRTFYQGRKGKEQIEMIQSFLHGMAIANPSVRFMLRHNKKLLWQHSSSKDVRDSLVSVYGNVADMVPLCHCENDSKIRITGMLSPLGKTTKKPPYYIINKRMVKFKSLSKLIRKMYEGSYPHGAICISLDSHSVDVNVEVDKSAVICKDEAQLLSIIEHVIKDQVLVSKLAPINLEQSQDFYDQNLSTPTRVESERDPSSNHSHSLFSSSHCSTELNPMESNASTLSTHHRSTACGKKEIMRDRIDIPDSLPVEIESGENLSFLDGIEEELDSQKELFSPTFANPEKQNENCSLFNSHQKLTNIIDEPKTIESTKTVKQTSLNSWSSTKDSNGFKIEFISPDKIGKTLSSKKRPWGSPPAVISDKKRKTTPLKSPVNIVKKDDGKTLSFNIHYVKQSLLFNRLHPPRCSNAKAFKMGGKWLVMYQNKLFSFNPNRAQEVNVYRKMLSSQSLKYGPVTDPGNWDICSGDADHDSMTFLSSLPSHTDPMGEMTFVSEKCLSVNGIRIQKLHDSRYKIVNVCGGVPNFAKSDVIETLHLIMKHKTSPENIENELSICDYSPVRCSKIRDSLKAKATHISKTFSTFQPSPTDVIDLFFNTGGSDKCIHDNQMKDLIWEFH